MNPFDPLKEYRLGWGEIRRQNRIRAERNARIVTAIWMLIIAAAALGVLAITAWR